MQRVLIIGGTAGIGRELAAHYASRGGSVVIAGRDGTRTAAVASEIGSAQATGAGGTVEGMAVDLSDPEGVPGALAGAGQVDSLVLAGMRRDQNSIERYSIPGASDLVLSKIVGYTAVVHAMRSRLAQTGSVLLFGGAAREFPYPGSTTVSAVNAAIDGLTTTLSAELAPVRVNAIHPGIVGDHPFWQDKRAYLEQLRPSILTGRHPTLRDVVDGAVFLLENQAANRVRLNLDGGQH